MAGWHIYICKQEAGGDSPAAAFRAPTGARLASWQTGWDGLRWINKLVAQEHAISLGGEGYPMQYTAKMEHLRAPILEGPPEANARWVIAEGTTFTGTPPASPTNIDEEALRACDDSEWMIIEAWDES